MQIDMDILNGARIGNNVNVLSGLFKEGKKVLKSGGKIEVVKKCTNAPTETEVVTTIERLSELTTL